MSTLTYRARWAWRPPKGLDLIGAQYQFTTGHAECVARAGSWGGQKQWRLRCHCGHEWLRGTPALRHKPPQTSCPECRRKARAA